MYTLYIKNNYGGTISTCNAKKIPANVGAMSFEKHWSIILEVPGMGAFNFLDLGNVKLLGYP